MKILLTGKSGQVGYGLERPLQSIVEVTAVDSRQMSLCLPEQVREVVAGIKPDLIVNQVAYIAVDMAEKHSVDAMQVNAAAPILLAAEAKKVGAEIIHYSTDYVFDGSKSAPYREENRTRPVNVYGASKLAGELAIQSTGVPHLTFRTNWVYGMCSRNFLLAKASDELPIVADQFGVPAWSRTLAEATAQVIAQLKFAKDAAQWWQQPRKRARRDKLARIRAEHCRPHRTGNVVGRCWHSDSGISDAGRTAAVFRAGQRQVRQGIQPDEAEMTKGIGSMHGLSVSANCIAFSFPPRQWRCSLHGRIC